MWKDNKQVKRQKTAEQAGGQLGGKAAVGAAAGAAAGAATAVGEETIKDKEGEIWDKEALDALFNKTIQYSVVNSYVSAITELYMWQLKGKALLLLWGAKLLAVLDSVHYNEDQIQCINFTN